MIARRVVLAVVTVVLVPFGASAAQASAGTSHPDSTNVNSGTDHFSDVMPCHDELGGYLITTTYNGQTHSTSNANGFWLTDTDTGTFSAVPIEVETDAQGDPVRDPETGNLVPVLDANGQPVARDAESFTGKFTQWFGESINPRESTATYTFHLHASGSVGTAIDAHENEHLVTQGGGDPLDPAAVFKREFDHATCH